MLRSASSPVSRVLLLVLPLVLITPGDATGASETTSGQPAPVSVAPERPKESSSGLPAYDCDIENGLYATITACSLDEPKLQEETKVKLRVADFKKDLEVRVLWQGEASPLVALVLGLATRSKDKMAQLWKHNLYQAGFSVMTFDSVFLPAFSERSRHGVAANLAVEARVVGKVVDAFLKLPEARNRVTKLGVVGISYGGTLALELAKLAAEGQVPIRPERVLAFSPPIRMKTAAGLLDKFYREDRWNYTMMDLASDILGHKPVPKGEPIPFTDSEMRAGIALAFRMDLKEVLEYGDRVYKLGLLPKRGLYDDEYRRDVAGTWTFTRFVEEAAFAYWAKHGNGSSLEDLWAAGDVIRLLPECPSTVRVILCQDDPLNDPAELEQLREVADPARLTVLPRGGHMGYNRTEWLKARLKKLFD
jgi:predicted alpha/beta-fold hydrolase